MVSFGSLATEIGSLVWGTPANFNGFRVLAALLHGTVLLLLLLLLLRAFIERKIAQGPQMR